MWGLAEQIISAFSFAALAALVAAAAILGYCSIQFEKQINAFRLSAESLAHSQQLQPAVNELSLQSRRLLVCSIVSTAIAVILGVMTLSDLQPSTESSKLLRQFQSELRKVEASIKDYTTAIDDERGVEKQARLRSEQFALEKRRDDLKRFVSTLEEAIVSEAIAKGAK